MRVIAGKFGGLRLEAVKGRATRPTTDKVKEAIFSMLLPYLNGGRVLDLYAGTGGLAIEAISRGMDEAVLVDKQQAALAVIEKNIEKTHAESAFTVLRGAASTVLGRLAAQQLRFDLVLLDPPYAKEKLKADIDRMISAGLLAKGAVVMIESDQVADLPKADERLALLKQKDYGITRVSLYRYEA
ncbi:16S rRNA (guanine(966)-N(2))-methyltransferase RsmD [Fructobacillus sp. M1-13]|uniref:16S rRNA (Guanine(966)-N(2))-methyltransferase RsmD n=1 Tax=Fructobacillus papyriferae TaxID=2713171 RepID=A0ABS5QPA6_9LACO|nr:16S rRNA (guanine(966)-N(2))-methyltransferase RsmD [Fructobacillus papyriferae]MBS9334920.1 16S rRNA (guanine(966)-N(2))-methyltransferase RsmD [Fructobacillus papyriferae]MCD2159596.1 16S rRNA (guanine(966)-N(2))-methyltransferase RsmD [Fructobacillus papyriferae]